METANTTSPKVLACPRCGNEPCKFMDKPVGATYTSYYGCIARSCGLGPYLVGYDEQDAADRWNRWVDTWRIENPKNMVCVATLATEVLCSMIKSGQASSAYERHRAAKESVKLSRIMLGLEE